jgi:hypothetical protein
LNQTDTVGFLLHVSNGARLDGASNEGNELCRLKEKARYIIWKNTQGKPRRKRIRNIVSYK